ncbi:prosaposin-like [Babylonia areolata]|uniref:prosaposin-like n=1 Tax=Babylonia areolata TaxID=304850 RepID=UPI003FD594EF
MKVLLLLAFAAVGQCALLGSKKCTYGPSYWCSHIHHAKECNAMQHCMTTVWKNQHLDMVGTTETCFDVIKVLDVVRLSSDNDLMEQWAVGCTGMPTEKRQLCKELMSHDLNEVSKLLKSDLSSRQIAGALTLCGGFADTVSHPQQVSADYCKDCVNFFNDVREKVNSSEGQVEALIKQMVCSKFGPLEDLCGQLVDQYADQIFKLAFEEMNPQLICQALSFCTNQTHAELMKTFKYLQSKQRLSSAECDVCQSLAKDVQEALKNPTLQTDVLEALKNDVCPILGSFADQCKNYVTTYGPVVFEILIGELDPQTICQTLGLCNATKSETGKLVHVSLGAPVGAVQIVAPEKEKSEIECFLCKKFVEEAEKVIADESPDKIKAIMEKVCKVLPSDDEQNCIDFVEKYGTFIIELLLSKVSPDEVCQLAEVCSSAKLQQTVKLQTPLKGSMKCWVCEEALTFVKQELDSPTVETDVTKILDKVCSKMGSYDGLCEEFVSKYTPAIINMVEEEIDPLKLCSTLDLCGKSVENKSQSQSHPLMFMPMAELQPAKPHLLGGKKCLFGPSFWCASKENARMCNAVEKCKMMGMTQKLDD